MSAHSISLTAVATAKAVSRIDPQVRRRARSGGQCVPVILLHLVPEQIDTSIGCVSVAV
jgi:hypothetical protein